MKRRMHRPVREQHAADCRAAWALCVLWRHRQLSQLESISLSDSARVARRVAPAWATSSPPVGSVPAALVRFSATAAAHRSCLDASRSSSGLLS
jgi:hypothetical protein